jgi:hypothetical protein
MYDRSQDPGSGVYSCQVPDDAGRVLVRQVHGGQTGTWEHDVLARQSGD